MPKATVSPDTNNMTGRVAATGGSLPGVLTDSSDSTYVRRSASGSPMAVLNIDISGTVPAGSDVATILPAIRLKDPTTGDRYLMAGIGQWSGSTFSVPAWLQTGTTINSIYDSALTAAQGASTQPAGGAWTAAPTDDYGIALNDGHSATDTNRAYVYKAAADVYYAARPTISAITVDPTTPVTTTSYPTFTATVSALIESWQTDTTTATTLTHYYEMHVFTDAVYGAGGFDPATATPVWSGYGSVKLAYTDGVNDSTASAAIACGLALPNDTYRVYVAARRGFTANVGAWSYATFTIDITPPDAPTLTAAIAQDYQAVDVSAMHAVGLTNPMVSVERSDDGGTTWVAVRNLTRVLNPASRIAAAMDHEAPRATSLRYRACVECTVDGLPLVSTWATVTVTGTITATGWNLKCPLAPADNIYGVAVTSDPDYTQAEDAAVFRPRGRTYPVVVSMGLGGADGSLTIDCATSAEWTDVETLKDYTGALLLQTPFGEQRYIRVLGRSWQTYGTGTAPRRRVKFDYLEVAAP